MEEEENGRSKSDGVHLLVEQSLIEQSFVGKDNYVDYNKSTQIENIFADTIVFWSQHGKPIVKREVVPCIPSNSNQNPDMGDATNTIPGRELLASLCQETQEIFEGDTISLSQTETTQLSQSDVITHLKNGIENQDKVCCDLTCQVLRVVGDKPKL